MGDRLTLAVYLAVAYWLARSAGPAELVSDYLIVLERSASGPGVVAGLLGATFRPTLRFPRVVPLFGAVGCIVAMVVINVVFTAIAFAVVVGFLVILLRRRIDSPFSDVRSDMFAAIADWASERAVASRQAAERGWRPRVLAPIEDTRQLRAAAPFLRDVTYPKGSVKMVGVRHSSDQTLVEGLTTVSRQLRSDQISTTWSVVDEDTFERGFLASIRATGKGLGRANIVYLAFPGSGEAERHAAQVLEEARGQGLGVLMTSTAYAGRLGGRGVINLWIREQGPDWTVSTDLQHSHLAILMAYKLRANWGGDINLVTAVEDPDPPSSMRCRSRRSPI